MSCHDGCQVPVRSLRLKLVGLLCLGWGQPEAVLAETASDAFEPGYHLSIDSSQTHLLTRYCARSLPARLGRQSRQARLIGRPQLRVEGSDSAVPLRLINGHSIDIPASGSPGCIEYQAALADLTEERYSRWLADGIWAISIPRWWWRAQGEAAAGLSADHRDVRFSLSPDQSVSAPWPLAEGSGHSSPSKPETLFRMPSKVNDRRGLLLVGAFKHQRYSPGAGDSLTVDLAIVQAESALDVQVASRLTDWVEHHLNNLWLAYGQWPVERLQLIVIPTIGVTRSAGYHPPGEISPVPWAEVLRGHGPAVLAVVDINRDAAALKHDWTLSHELAHLLHPIMPGSMRWVYEGIGSYYQNILRARSGDLTEQQAWQQLFDGFERGRAATVAGTRLSDGQRQAGGIMRVYWSGVALALTTDIQLRLDSENRMSLDQALLRLKACCIREHRVVSPDLLMTWMQEVTGNDVFEKNFRAIQRRPAFPDMTQVMAWLGIRLLEGRVVLDDSPVHRMRRQWITANPVTGSR